jgi:hypothetical protein
MLQRPRQEVSKKLDDPIKAGEGDEPRSEMLIELFEGVYLRIVLYLLWECKYVVWMKKQRHNRHDGRVSVNQ